MGSGDLEGAAESSFEKLTQLLLLWRFGDKTADGRSHSVSASLCNSYFQEKQIFKKKTTKKYNLIIMKIKNNFTFVILIFSFLMWTLYLQGKRFKAVL